MRNVMLDLETMGNGPNAAIVAIGAVAFDIETGTIGDKFYKLVDLTTAVDCGGVMDASTVMWWVQQGQGARLALVADAATHLRGALDMFADWLTKTTNGQEPHVWGNGAAFDNVILASAYRNAGKPQPWKHWNDRCYRTVKALYPAVKLERTGTHHIAVDDAESQARHLIAMLGRVEVHARRQLTEAAVREMLDDTRAVFNATDGTPQVAHDVIEYVASWCAVYADKSDSAAPMAPTTAGSA
jgi:exodeoxyribonuclease VIII